jgi:hypothetical protein
MAIERAVLPEQVRVNILSSEGARSTGRCSHKRIVPSAAWNLSITSEVAAGLPGKLSEMRERLAKPSPSWPTSPSRPAARQNKPRRRSRQMPIKRQKAFVVRPHLAN